MSHSSFITLCISHIIHSLQCYFDSTVSSGGQGWHCEAVGHDICSRESEALSICVSRRPTDPPKRWSCESLPTPLWSSKAFCAAATSIASWAAKCTFCLFFVTIRKIRQVHFRSSEGLDGLVLRVHCWALPSLPLWKVKVWPWAHEPTYMRHMQKTCVVSDARKWSCSKCPYDTGDIDSRVDRLGHCFVHSELLLRYQKHSTPMWSFQLKLRPIWRDMSFWCKVYL